jgi:hypothetical protein
MATFDDILRPDNLAAAALAVTEFLSQPEGGRFYLYGDDLYFHPDTVQSGHDLVPDAQSVVESEGGVTVSFPCQGKRLAETFSLGSHLALASQLDLLFVKIDAGLAGERQVTIRRRDR